MRMVLYHSENDDVSVNAIIKYETLWITQKAMAELFVCSTDNIGLHLKNIYADGELDKNATTEKNSVVQQEGNSFYIPSTICNFTINRKRISVC